MVTCSSTRRYAGTLVRLFGFRSLFYTFLRTSRLVDDGEKVAKQTVKHSKYLNHVYDVSNNLNHGENSGFTDHHASMINDHRVLLYRDDEINMSFILRLPSYYSLSSLSILWLLRSSTI